MQKPVGFRIVGEGHTMKTWNPEANQIFLNAIEIDDPEGQRQYVIDACRSDRQLFKRVESLLRSHVSAGQFLGAADQDTKCQDRPSTRPYSGKQVPEFFRPGKRFADQFQICKIIGQGGMGIVALAEQVEPIRRQVAIKISRPNCLTNEFAARFDQERRVLAMMDHPNIAKVLEAGFFVPGTGRIDRIDAGRQKTHHAFLVMEFVEGKPIHQFCDERKLNLKERVRLIIQVGKAVQHAHAKGIVHRDLKPSNILVSEVDRQAVTKVIDFGIAKPIEAKPGDSRQTGQFQLIGTLDYMSPEQSRFEGEVDARSDVYSLGAVLFELLTGSVSLQRKSDHGDPLLAAINQLQNDDPSLPSLRTKRLEDLETVAFRRRASAKKLPKLLRGDLDWITLKALHRDPEQRYQSIGQLVDELERYLSNEPVSASAPTWRYRLGKAYARNRLATVMAASFVLLLIVGIIGTSIGFVQAAFYASQAQSNEQRVGELLSESYEQTARAAIRRGQWRVVERALKAAILHRGHLSFSEQLLQLHSLVGQNRIGEFESAVTSLSLETASNVEEAQFKLWLAELKLFRGEHNDHFDLVREAIDLGLPQDDHFYAQSLLAESTVESINCLDDCLAVNPFHFRANQNQIVTHISLGRFQKARSHLDRARLLFPDDSMLIVAESCIDVFQGRSELALDRVTNSPLIATNRKDDFLGLLKDLDNICNGINTAIKQRQRTKVALRDSGFFSAHHNLGKTFQSGWLRIPARLQQNVSRTTRAVGQAMVRRKIPGTFEQLYKAGQLHPDGLVFLLEGTLCAASQGLGICDQLLRPCSEALKLFFRRQTKSHAWLDHDRNKSR